MQTGDSFEQAKVFKAHAVVQGLCANLIDALKLLAKQQEDGDGLTNGLREFINVDKERALDVGSSSRSMRTFQVREPKVPEGRPEVIVRENSDELTLRAEEVGTSKALINVDHIEQERWGRPWLMLTGVPSARRCTMASKEKIGKKCMSLTKK